MPITISIANTPELLDEVFKIRYTVFTEEEGVFPENEEKRHMDRFDAYPTSHNLVVKTGDQVVGSFRLTLDSEVGVPADAFYDFRKLLPPDAKVMGSGLLCVTKNYRDPKVFTGLIMMASYFGLTHDVTHVIAPINPLIATLLTKRVGFRAVGEEFIENKTGIPMVPLILDTSELKDFFVNFVKTNKLLDFLGDYERWFFKAGEYVIRAGEKGQEAFILIEGTAHIKLPGSDDIFEELHEGEIFGELSLITDSERSANVVAHTDLQVMRLSKSTFQNRLLTNPAQTLNLLRLLGGRNLSLLHKLEDKKNL